MAFALCACGPKTETPAPVAPAAGAPAAEPAVLDEEAAYFEELVAAAKAEGELVIYGLCEDLYIAAADAFGEKYDILTSWQRLTGGELQAKVEEENGNPSGEVWFVGTSDPLAVCASKGILDKNDANNAVHLVADKYRDADGYWYGIYTGIIGFFDNME